MESWSGRDTIVRNEVGFRPRSVSGRNDLGPRLVRPEPEIILPQNDSFADLKIGSIFALTMDIYDSKKGRWPWSRSSFDVYHVGQIEGRLVLNRVELGDRKFRNGQDAVRAAKKILGK